MDRNEKIQNAVDNLISDVRGRGWKLTRTTKKALAEAEALGLTQYLGAYARPEVKGAEIVSAVIDAAKDAGGKRVTESGWTSGGDGDAYTTTTEPSALYLALNVPEGDEGEAGWHETVNERGEKVMVNPHGQQLDFEAALGNMDDDLREALHMSLAPCSEAKFFAAYASAHSERYGEEWELAKDNPVW